MLVRQIIGGMPKDVDAIDSDANDPAECGGVHSSVGTGIKVKHPAATPEGPKLGDSIFTVQIVYRSANAINHIRSERRVIGRRYDNARRSKRSGATTQQTAAVAAMRAMGLAVLTAGQGLKPSCGRYSRFTRCKAMHVTST